MENDQNVYTTNEATESKPEVFDAETGQLIESQPEVNLHKDESGIDAKTGGLILGATAGASVLAGAGIKALYDAHKTKLHKQHKKTLLEKIFRVKDEVAFRIDVPEGYDLFQVDENGDPIIPEKTESKETK